MKMMSVKQTELLKKIALVLVPLCVMTLIFLFSQESGSDSNRRSDAFLEFVGKFVDITSENAMWWATYITRKVAHIVVFFLLYIATYFVASNFSRRPLSKIRTSTICIVVCVVFAIFDEVHQIFIPGRTASVLDVLIDSFGVLLAFILIRKYKKHKD